MTGEKWAVKIVEKRLLKKGVPGNRYLKEIYMLKKLDHPNINQIHEYF